MSYTKIDIVAISQRKQNCRPKIVDELEGGLINNVYRKRQA